MCSYIVCWCIVQNEIFHAGDAKRETRTTTVVDNVHAYARKTPLLTVLERTIVHVIVLISNSHTSFNPFPPKIKNVDPLSPSGVVIVPPFLFGGTTPSLASTRDHDSAVRSNFHNSSKSPYPAEYPPNTYKFPPSAHAVAPVRPHGASVPLPSCKRVQFPYSPLVASFTISNSHTSANALPSYNPPNTTNLLYVAPVVNIALAAPLLRSGSTPNRFGSRDVALGVTLVCASTPSGAFTTPPTHIIITIIVIHARIVTIIIIIIRARPPINQSIKSINHARAVTPTPPHDRPARVVHDRPVASIFTSASM
mmetsp:Transcript_4810/g.15672  ORF Transcript_4810/g.15672 Transcript_4810/m.15672 type:complete len:309 (-) Transcript_4810:69-995(-)